MPSAKPSFTTRICPYGAQAIADDARGRTQRVVIVEALSRSILRELSQDGGAATADALPRAQNPS